MIVCFILNLRFYIFLNMLMCHLEIGGQKTHDFCHDRMTAPLLHFYFIRFLVHQHSHCRRPFLHLTHVGSLDEYLFSRDDHDDGSPFGFTRRAPPQWHPRVSWQFRPQSRAFGSHDRQRDQHPQDRTHGDYFQSRQLEPLSLRRRRRLEQ